MQICAMQWIVGIHEMSVTLFYLSNGHGNVCGGPGAERFCKMPRPDTKRGNIYTGNAIFLLKLHARDSLLHLWLS